MTLLVQLGDMKPIQGSYQQLSPVAATGLTVPAGAAAAVMSVSTASVRYRDDGSAPDATHGVVLPVTTSGLPFSYMGDLSKIQFISATGVLDILYYGYG
jgi:hypothetical protein